MKEQQVVEIVGKPWMNGYLSNHVIHENLVKICIPTEKKRIELKKKRKLKKKH